MLQGMAVFSLMAIAMLFSQKALAETKSSGLEIIVDVSGSMNEAISGKSKMNIAKEVLTTTINGIPDTSFVGLRVYGDQGTVAEKNCTDTRLLAPIAKINKTDLISKINSLTPKGWTPIDYSLRQSKNDFNPEYGKVIILISDGEETCGGDPCAAIKELKNSGFDVTVHTVGFDVGDVAEKQLKCIADATGGEYKSAKNASELAESLRVFSTRAFQNFQTAGGTTAGTGFTDAPLVTAGKFGGDVLIEENKFYKFNVKKGQNITTVLNIRRETAFSIYQPRVAGKGIVNCYPGMQPAIKIYDKYQSQVASGNGEDGKSWTGKTIDGSDVSLNSFKATWVADSSGEVFVSLSNAWQYPPEVDCKDHQNQKYQKALYDLVIAIEGEGEADPIPAKKVVEENIETGTGAGRTKNETPKTERNIIDEEEITANEKGNSLIWIFAGVGIVLILVIIILIIVLLKKKNNASSEIMMNSSIPNNNYNPNVMPDPNQTNNQNPNDLSGGNNQI